MLPDLLLKFKARAQGGLRFHSRLQLQLSPHDRRSCQLCATEMHLSRASVSSEQAGSHSTFLVSQTLKELAVSFFLTGWSNEECKPTKRSEIEVYVAK